MRRVTRHAHQLDGGERTQLNPLGQLCRSITDVLLALPECGWFRDPVSEVAAPGYYKIIKRPMYFSLIVQNLENCKYAMVGEYVRDVRQVFYNAFYYNAQETPVYKAAQHVASTFEFEYSQKVLIQYPDGSAPLLEIVTPEPNKNIAEAMEKIVKVICGHAVAGNLNSLAHTIAAVPIPPPIFSLLPPKSENPNELHSPVDNDTPSSESNSAMKRHVEDNAYEERPRRVPRVQVKEDKVEYPLEPITERPQVHFSDSEESLNNYD